MPMSCEDYRYQQQLLALKKRLAEDKLEPEEREEIEKAIQELERKLKIQGPEDVAERSKGHSSGRYKWCPAGILK